MKRTKIIGVVLLAVVALLVVSSANAQSPLPATGNGLSVNLALSVGESLTISSPQANTTVNLVWNTANSRWDSTLSPISISLQWNLASTRSAVMLYAWLSTPTPFSGLATPSQVVFNSNIGGGSCGGSTLQTNTGSTLTVAGIGVAGQDCGSFTASSSPSSSSGTTVTNGV